MRNLCDLCVNMFLTYVLLRIKHEFHYGKAWKNFGVHLFQSGRGFPNGLEEKFSCF